MNSRRGPRMAGVPFAVDHEVSVEEAFEVVGVSNSGKACCFLSSHILVDCRCKSTEVFQNILSSWIVGVSSIRTFLVKAECDEILDIGRVVGRD